MKLSDIKLNEDNPRYIRDDKFEQLKQSIRTFPQMLRLRPIVIDENNIVLGGNMRLRALQELGYTELEDEWVKRADELTEEQKREFIIKDNVGYGSWEWETLANEWDSEELAEWGLDVPEDWVSEEEVEAEEDDYEEPDNLQVDVVLGDLIEIGEHRLLCGDSTDSNQVAKLMGGEKADMVFTDPPYNINYGAGNQKHPSWKSGDRVIQNDQMPSSEYKDFIRSVFGCMSTVCDGVIYCWGAQGKYGRICFTVLDEMFHNSGTIIWVKDSLVLGRSKYHSKYEPCWFGWIKTGKTFTDDRTLTNVWEVDRPKISAEHPTMKPVKLVEMALYHNPKAKSVIDSFLGSGTTMVAAHQLKRKCYGMELDPKYCQVIIDRMHKLDPSLPIKINGKDYQPKTAE